MRRILALVVVAASLAVAGPAGAKSTDSLAPPNAPPHWLPPEPWVYNHWLPYDEGRLYRLLHIKREQLWHQLRDDHHNVAELAASNGWREPKRLAAALVAPRAKQVGPARLKILRERALRTITQGHLAQHIFFHSLHQFAIPSAAPDIFGVTDIEFRLLRRSELSPLEIGRLHGRSPARVQALSAAILRERVDAGVAGQAMTARQGRTLLARQLSQLPRWLGQERYNGPPQTHEGTLVNKPRNYASNPALAADGVHVAFEAYQQKLPLTLANGEISVLVHDLGSAVDKLASPPNPDCSTPSSSYNPTISGDGSVAAFECAEGNLNFAKRYGRIKLFLCDVSKGSSRIVEDPDEHGAGVSRSLYNPALSADGHWLAFEAVRPGGHSAVLVRDLQTGTTTIASSGLRGDFYEPSISADGRVVAFTAVASSSANSRVYARDLVAGTTTLVSRRSGAGGRVAGAFSSNPVLSGDGRFVAFASAARNLGGGRVARGRTRVYVRDLATATTIAVSGLRDGFALDPSISGDGSVIAYTSVVGGQSRVLVRDLRSGSTQLVSRADGVSGGEADNAARNPSISSDGTRVAFASNATNLSAAKPDDTRGVFVRDLGAQTTTLVSGAVGAS